MPASEISLPEPGAVFAKSSNPWWIRISDLELSPEERAAFARPLAELTETRMRKPMKTMKKDANDTKSRGMGKEKVPAKTKNNVKALAHMGKKKKSA